MTRATIFATQCVENPTNPKTEKDLRNIATKHKNSPPRHQPPITTLRPLCHLTPLTPNFQNLTVPRSKFIVYLVYMRGIYQLAVYSVCLCAFTAAAQTPAPSRFVGTVTGFNVDAAEIVVKPDNGSPVTAKVTSDTISERIEPGAKDLKNAQPAKISDIAIGDRVLVVLMPDGSMVRRIVVMSATDITKRNEADRADWNKRGLLGVVASKNGNDLTLKMRRMQGEVQAVVTVSDKTIYRRYAPDSVKFADVKASKLDEISVGDQVRARGQKSEDGLKVTAEEIVFGSFQTKAGAVTAVNPDTKEITLKELGSGKPLVVKLTGDSQLKKMPNFGAMGGGAPGGAAPAGGRSGAPGAGGGPMMAGRGGGGFDLAQMIDRMPPAKFDDVKPGETIIVSSTKGAKSDEITAITLLSNADGLIRMLTMMSAASAGRGAAAGASGPSLSGLATGLDSLNIPGITP